MRHADGLAKPLETCPPEQALSRGSFCETHAAPQIVREPGSFQLLRTRGSSSMCKLPFVIPTRAHGGAAGSGRAAGTHVYCHQLSRQQPVIH